MYTTCLFCHADLGRNEALEAFPVGRRLAYDAEKGRLWVVCRGCERWNLTPQEERWEAMEQAERLYRGTRLRASTDNVGLARLGDGTELVRVGRPLRPEFAAWRYGDQFGRRRRKHLAFGALTVGVGGSAIVWGAAAGAGGWLLWQAGAHAYRLVRHGRGGARVAHVQAEAPSPLVVRREHVGRTYFTEAEGGAPALSLCHTRGRTILAGDAATSAAALLLPATNRYAGSAQDVTRAVARLEQSASPARLLLHAAGVERARGGGRRSRGVGGASEATGAEWYENGLFALDTSLRLALEMAVHEDQERRALDGELLDLEDAWRRAEEIAAIADDLLLPERLTQKLAQLRGRSSARAGAASSPASDSGGATSS